MNRFLHGVVRAVADAFALPAPILEIGSRHVPGQEELVELRGLFPGRPYVGVDVRPGPGVDCVADVEALPWADGSAGTVLALNTFEHVPRFWRGFDEVYRVLRPDGALVVSCPFYFRIHNHPADYWRFTPQALEVLLEKYPSRIIGWHGPARRPLHVWAAAFREGHAPLTAEQVARYRLQLGRHARQPARRGRRLRYRLGRLLFGRRPFAPFLDVEHWETEWRTPCRS
jgi:SAM-dependent methyltransferase